jgi:hypothetical protein
MMNDLNIFQDIIQDYLYNRKVKSIIKERKKFAQSMATQSCIAWLEDIKSPEGYDYEFKYVKLMLSLRPYAEKCYFSPYGRPLYYLFNMNILYLKNRLEILVNIAEIIIEYKIPPDVDEKTFQTLFNFDLDFKY